MGESSALLVRTFSPNSSEEKKGNSIKRALTSSVSFGRFVSESLDWERFSAFNQNRYLEEVERYSKPGSVAEKKAYFEAHYKKKRAAALLEQQNVNNATCKVDDESCLESELATSEVVVVSENTEEEDVSSCETVVSVSCEAEIGRELGDVQGNEPMVVDESPEQLTNHIANDVSREQSMECEDASSSLSNEDKPEVSSSHLQNVNSTKQVPLAPVPPPVKATMPGRLVNKEKPTLNSRNIVKDYGNKKTRTIPASTRQVPLARIPPLVRPVTPGRHVNKEKMTLNSRNNENDYSNKKTRSTTTSSLHMSINFPPRYVETQKPVPPVLPPKNVNSRLVKTPLKKANNNTLPQILTRASVNGICNTSSENRTVRQHVNSLQGSRIADGKLPSLSTSYSKTSNTLASNGRSLAVSASFSFKSEERVAKRREFFEKLEQKVKSKEPNKQLHAKPQVKARNDLKDHLKASKSTDTTSNITKKSLNAVSPKIKERVPFRVQDNDSRPPWRFSKKIDISREVVTGKNNHPICSAKSFLKKNACENSSPNVQL